jgi:hypothetical protein
MTEDKVQEFPTDVVVSESVKSAVVSAYARLHELGQASVEEGYKGGIPFDSLLGIELASAVEGDLGIKIPEGHLMKTAVFRSLATFAAMVQVCVNEGLAPQGTTPT